MRTRDRKSICTSFGRDRPAKALRPESRGPGGQDARRWIQAKKISSTKAFLIVILISPSSLKNVQMQMFCTSLEPNTKQWQGTDLSIMTAIKITNPGTKSPFDLGVRCKPHSDTTRGTIAAFNSMLGGTISTNRKCHLMT